MARRELTSGGRSGRLALLAVAIVLLAGITWGVAGALAASPAASPSSAPGQVVLKLGWTSEPDNLNVFVGYEATAWEIWALNYDYLFGSGTHNQPTLDLANVFPSLQNGGISADGKIWTIHIRGGVKFQDGTPLTAADVAFTYNYIIKNNIAQYTTYMAGILKAKALDPTTVQFTCAHPMALGFMETQSVPILPEHIWSKVSPQAATTSYGNKAPLVGSGPFQVVKIVKGSYIEMDKNPTYWGPKPAIDKIFFEVYQDPETMVTDLDAGRLDGAWGIPVAQFQQLKSAAGLKAIAYPYYGLDDVEFNCYDKPTSLGNPVLRDWRFRNALNYAVDRQRLCDISYNGLAEPGTTILLPNTWVNPDYHWQPAAGQAYTFDLTKAGQLLTAAGYPLKNGVRVNKQGKPIVLRLETLADDAAKQSSAKLITGWFQQLGLKIKLSVIDSGALDAAMTNMKGSAYAPDFDIVLWDLIGNYDPGQTMYYFTTSQLGINNDYYWSNPTYDKLAVDQASAVDPLKRKDIIWQMQQIMYQQTPDIVLNYPENLEAVNTSRWTGWAPLWVTSGPVWNCQGNIASYLALRPVVSSSGSGGSSTGALIAVAVVVVIVIAGIVFVVSRRRRQHVDVEV
jgi:peptide/nickel transport system substrate-binding protein